MRDLQTFEPALPEDGRAAEQIAPEQIAIDQIAIDEGQTAAAAAKAEEPAKRSRWRSMGGIFDYEHWEDRDRFVELDFLILLSKSDEDERFRPRRSAHLAAA